MSADYKKKREQGICYHCPQPALSGRRLCQKCLDRNKQDTRNRRLVRGSKNLCKRCGQRSPLPNKKRCQVCVDKSKTQYDKRLTELERVERKAAGLCITLGCSSDAQPQRSKCTRCIKYGTNHHRKLKQVVLNHYGQVCNCHCGCRVKTFEWLTIDHINNDGAEQRRKARKITKTSIYRQIIKTGFPKDLQILCWNCNASKGAYGRCPGNGPDAD